MMPNPMATARAAQQAKRHSKKAKTAAATAARQHLRALEPAEQHPMWSKTDMLWLLLACLEDWPFVGRLAMTFSGFRVLVKRPPGPHQVWSDVDILGRLMAQLPPKAEGLLSMVSCCCKATVATNRRFARCLRPRKQVESCRREQLAEIAGAAVGVKFPFGLAKAINDNGVKCTVYCRSLRPDAFDVALAKTGDTVAVLLSSKDLAGELRRKLQVSEVEQLLSKGFLRRAAASAWLQARKMGIRDLGRQPIDRSFGFYPRTTCLDTKW